MSARESTKLLGGADEARAAFEEKDVEASRNYHDDRDPSPEMHQLGGDLLKPLIFGGLDGILTSFAIVAGAAGGKLPSEVVLILGFSNIFADALSMGVGEFLSSKAENEWILKERKREEWELENYPEGEIREMVEIYEQRGLETEDAEVIVKTMAKYKSFFVDVMMNHELELQVPEDDHLTESFKEGAVMFCSFAFFGSLPILGYVIFPAAFPEMSTTDLFVIACVITGVVLFFLGSIKSMFSARHWFWAGLETFLLGGLCAGVAFGIGKLVGSFLSKHI